MATGEDESPFDRVVFVCRNRNGHYSPGVYLHGPAGGGPACLGIVREAARSMRAPEVGDAAAGLCGYIFQQAGPDVASGGGLSLLDPPRPGKDGTVDWQAYCSWEVDLILIDVDAGTAECFVSPPDDPDAPAKRLIRRIDGLKFGR
jgi:hypothetical protein